MALFKRYCLMLLTIYTIFLTLWILSHQLSVISRRFNYRKPDVFNSTSDIRSTCACNEGQACKKLGQITTFLPCFPSTLLDSTIACHDSYSCKDNQTLENHLPQSHVSRRAFFSALYKDNTYVKGALLLGYTLKKLHPTYNVYMMYFEGKLSNTTLCSLKQVGWILKPVRKISPPLRGTLLHFAHQFTKLSLWNMTEFDSIVYLDADTLVLGNIENLHDLVADPSRTRFEFAAVADHWHSKFAYHFNAGVFVLHPSAAVFRELIRTMQLPGNYDPKWAEQAFLNAFFQLRYLQLPLIYNVNLSFYRRYPDLWKTLQRDFKIVHFTVLKPFQNRTKEPYNKPAQLYYNAWREFNRSELAEQVKERCNYAF